MFGGIPPIDQDDGEKVYTKLFGEQDLQYRNFSRIVLLMDHRQTHTAKSSILQETSPRYSTCEGDIVSFEEQQSFYAWWWILVGHEISRIRIIIWMPWSVTNLTLPIKQTVCRGRNGLWEKIG